MLPTSEYQANKNNDISFGVHPRRALNQVQGQIHAEDDNDESGSSTHLSASLFEELEAARGSRRQYELQQLGFANQWLYEELHALESMHVAKSGSRSGSGSPSSMRGHMAAAPRGQPGSSSSASNVTISMPPATVAANADPALLHAVDAFDIPFVCIFALSQLARAGPTDLRLVFVSWCEQTWPKSLEVLVAFRGRPDDVGLELTVPCNEGEGTVLADGSRQVDVVSAAKTRARLALSLCSLSYCTCSHAYFSFPAAPFLVLSLNMLCFACFVLLHNFAMV